MYTRTRVQFYKMELKNIFPTVVVTIIESYCVLRCLSVADNETVIMYDKDNFQTSYMIQRYATSIKNKKSKTKLFVEDRVYLIDLTGVRYLTPGGWKFMANGKSILSMYPKLVWYDAVPTYAQSTFFLIGGRIRSRSYGNTEYDITNQVYKLVGTTWILCAPMACKRWKHVSVTLNDKIYVIGGWDTVSSHQSIEVYDIATNKWNVIESRSSKESKCIALVHKGCIYVFAGMYQHRNIERYNPKTNRWYPCLCKAIPQGVEDFEVVSWGDYMYIMGGYNWVDYNTRVKFYDTIQYNPSDGSMKLLSRNDSYNCSGLSLF